MGSVANLFANPTLVDVLSLFLQHPEAEFYQTEIVRQTHKALMQVQRALKVLVGIGLISSEQQGKMVYYKAVREHPAFEDLKRLFLKTVMLGDTLRKALKPFTSRISLAFIFGSYARGEEGVDSDIDLMLVAALSLEERAKIFGPLTRQIQRELNPVVIAPQEFEKMVLEKDHFVLELVHSPKLWIVGGEDELKRVGAKRKTQSSQDIRKRNRPTTYSRRKRFNRRSGARAVCR